MGNIVWCVVFFIFSPLDGAQHKDSLTTVGQSSPAFFQLLSPLAEQDDSPLADLQPPLESLVGLFNPNAKAAAAKAHQNTEVETTDITLSGQSFEAEINKLLLEQIDPLATPSTRLKNKVFNMIPSGSPVPTQEITSVFGERIHPKTRTHEFHPGVDLRAPVRTPVKTTAEGVVEYGGFHTEDGYGNMVVIHHNFGFKTIYGHMNDVVVRNGDFVRKGDLLGHSGSTGLSSGPHLHYEVRFVQRMLDPVPFIHWNTENYASLFKVRSVAWQPLIDQISTMGEQPLADNLRVAAKDEVTQAFRR